MLSVALLAEGVDRNLLADCWGVLNVVSPSSRRAWIEMFLVLRSVNTSSVALLAEGVDRNNLLPYRCHAYRVALLAEGVDRNRDAGDAGPFSGQSPSSRRAWIEIVKSVLNTVSLIVALLAEGVDRNSSHKAVDVDGYVALLAEGVDRNIARSFLPSYLRGRPPRGGRG